jgi:hypothetical protein
MAVARLINKAWNDPAERLAKVTDLCTAVDDLKITLQIASQVHAFGGFKEFEAIAKLVHELGAQSGGWRKKLHSMGQNEGAGKLSQRAPILSSPAAHGARL